MNTIMRTLGGAVGGQLSATFIAHNIAPGFPAVTRFTDTYVMATLFLVVCALAGLLIPDRLARSSIDHERRLATVAEPS
jgi:fructose-specific phosphotransferase system IIC component